jgi:hypothetical protein
MRRRSRKPPAVADATDLLKTLEAEIDEGAELLRPFYPDAGGDELRDRALSLLRNRYARGHWPTAEEIEAKKAEEAEKEGKAEKPWPTTSC